MSRRRVAMALLVLVAGGALIAWRVGPRCDPRLVGTWIETPDWIETPQRWATAEQIERASDPDRPLPWMKWSLRDDGSANIVSIFMGGDGACRWRTDGDRLRVKHGPTETNLQERILGLWEILCGGARGRWREYGYEFVDARRVRLAAEGGQGRVIHLTRIDKRPP